MYWGTERATSWHLRERGNVVRQKQKGQHSLCKEHRGLGGRLFGGVHPPLGGWRGSQLGEGSTLPRGPANPGRVQLCAVWKRGHPSGVRPGSPEREERNEPARLARTHLQVQGPPAGEPRAHQRDGGQARCWGQIADSAMLSAGLGTWPLPPSHLFRVERCVQPYRADLGCLLLEIHRRQGGPVVLATRIMQISFAICADTLGAPDTWDQPTVVGVIRGPSVTWVIWGRASLPRQI